MTKTELIIVLAVVLPWALIFGIGAIFDSRIARTGDPAPPGY